MKDFEEHIEDLGAQRKELRKLQSEVSDGKAQYTISMLGALLETLEQTTGKLIVQNADTKHYDVELCNSLKETVTKITETVSKLKPPTVTVTPNISVDLKPLQSIAGDISGQNKILISLIGKLNSNGENGELYRLIVAMVGRNNAFIEKGFQAADYTQQLKEISTGVNKKPVEWLGKVTKRTPGDRLIDEFYIKPKQ